MIWLVILLFIHFIGDFVLQSDWMAVSKSSSWKALSVHILVYTIFLVPFFGIKFAVVNGVLHFITDAVTSRLTTYLWKKEKRHWFFVVIGFDQFIHTACLLMTVEYLFLR